MIKPWNQKHFFCALKVCIVLSSSLHKYPTYILAEKANLALKYILKEYSVLLLM